MTLSFERLVYRARDVDAARVFYATVLGEPEIEIVPLPAAAAARGAPSHWVGSVGVDSVQETLAAFIARGATALGAVQHDARGPHALVRDPGGALIGLCAAGVGSMRPAIAWLHLDARDADATFGLYSELFGWTRSSPTEQGVERFAL